MTATKSLSRWMLVAALGQAAALAACSDNGSTGAGGGGSASSTEGGGGSPSSGQGGGGGGGSLAPAFTFITHFDGAQNELPEGLVITADGKTAYVGYALTGKIVKVSLPDGAVTAFGGLAAPPLNGGLMLGLALDISGDLFAAVTGVAKAGAGIYRIDRTTGAAALFVDHFKMVFPNGFAFMSDGSLLVTDSILGEVFKIDVKNKTIIEWVAHPLLAGDPSAANACAMGLPPYPVGASGIVVVGNKAYVANTDNAKLIQIPINSDGTAGTPVEYRQSDATCAPLRGADGMVADADGGLFLAGSSANALVRIDNAGQVAGTVVEANPRLDYPASVALATVDGKRYAFLTNFAFSTKAQPGLIAYGPLP